MKTSLLLIMAFLSTVALGQFRYSAPSNAGNGGQFCVLIGPQAGVNNASLYNTFLGYSSGANTTTGQANTFLGTAAGYGNATGHYNNVIGYQAGYGSISGDFNNVMGYQAGYSNAGGSYNLFLGYQAGYSNTAGSHNNFVGNRVGVNNTTGYNNSFLGAESGVANNTGYNNSFIGYWAGYKNTSGAFNTFVGYQAGLNTTTGRGVTGIGHLAGPASGALENATAIGNRARVSVSHALVLGSINGVNGSVMSTKVGIGTFSPTYRLHVNASDAAKVGGGSWIVASDKRLKKDITPFNDGLNVLLQINPVAFRYNGKAGIDTEKAFVGVIAQEMQKIAPYTVGEFVYLDSTGKQEQYLDYDPNALTYVLVNAIKEVDYKYQQQLAHQDAQLQSQQQQITALETRLARLEALLTKQSEEKPSSARLYQNQPNPFSETTTIKYFLPQTTTSACLKIYSVTGQEVFSQTLMQKGEAQIELSPAALPAGTYLYQLLVDGQLVDTKKLVLNW